MDNSQMPPVQSMGPSMAPNSGVSGGAAASTPGMPMVQQVHVVPTPKKDFSDLIKTIVIIVVSLIAVAFIGLFFWILVQYNDVQEDVQGQIDTAVADAKNEQAKQLEAEFLNREKYPYEVFSGPVDYGQLTFEYPKTWSVYVAAAATSGGDFNAYFNPGQVDAVGKETINALRVTIRDKSIDEVSEEYDKAMKKKDANLTMESVTIGANNNITANRYTGNIPDANGLSGYIVTFKIRDKTAIVQTDSVLFQAEYDKLLGTITFNE